MIMVRREDLRDRRAVEDGLRKVLVLVEGGREVDLRVRERPLVGAKEGRHEASHAVVLHVIARRGRLKRLRILNQRGAQLDEPVGPHSLARIRDNRTVE